MKKLERFKSFFTKKHSEPLPLLIIKKNADDANVKEYNSIEEAIEDLEMDPNVSADKIEKLRSAFKSLKNKSAIRIRNGELINSEKSKK
ncbi:MAG: hypothetical protein NTY96_05980 [Bacteroidetes bacterium]|nr:hypothetical protein [Bacteroidota bacterium]